MLSQGHRDLKLFQLSYTLAMEIYNVSKSFPREERYSLTDQIRRSSRSVPANIAEGYRKRQYLNMFVNKLSDADGETAETSVWIDFARDCGYINSKQHDDWINRYEIVGRMLGKMMSKPESFKPRALPSVSR